MAKISLCMIVGQAEDYIERCLKSFLPIADEIVLVRAIGNQTPDETFNIVTKLQITDAIKVPVRFGEYRNKPRHEDWPHVDDFAAARQLSFDLASHECCFWCDTDDILQEGAELVREHAANNGYAAYMFAYKIFGSNINLPRERLFKKSAGRWKFPVHECFDFHLNADGSKVQAAHDDRVVLLHLPKHDHTGSHPRNLRILKSIPDSDMTTGLLFHLHEELTLAGEIPAALEVAQRVLEREDLGRPEKMNLFLNLAASTPSERPEEKYQLYIQAYAADPRRREALGMMVNHALNYGKFSTALAFALQMLALPPLWPPPWNELAAFYGWLGEDLYAQTLRMNGKAAEAEQVRLESLSKSGGARISLIHATRGRPEQACATRKLWMDWAAKPEQVEHIFVFDSDDVDSRMLRRFHHLEVPAGGGCVSAWNQGAFLSKSPVIVQLSDDWQPPQRWDDLIINRLEAAAGLAGQSLDDFKGVLAVSDGQRVDQLLCMAILTRAYLREDMFLFHPGFKSMYSDNWFTREAYRRGVVVEARDIVFKHFHPAFGNAVMDATYEQQNAPERYAAGLELYNDLCAGNDWSSIPGFFDYFMFYQFVANGLKDGDVVAEVGVWFGRSIIFLAQLLKRQGKKVRLLAVDHFRGETGIPEHQTVVAANSGSIRAQFDANVKRCGVADMIEVLDGDSAAMAAYVPDGSLSLCFIDAAHDYQSVRKDLDAWWPKVREGGAFAGHDAQWHEVERAVNEKFSGPSHKPCIMGALWIIKEQQ